MAVPSSLEMLLFLVIVCVVQVASAAAATIVCLGSNNQQCIQGVDKVTSLSTKYEAFMGIPFAKPPVGQLRFANPVLNDPWIGIYDASKQKPACVQRNDLFPVNNEVSEDCLYLNVYRPKNGSLNLPTLVYLYGVGFQIGYADPTLSGPDRLMNSQNVILVTVSYRLGVLGFLSTGDSVAPGNFGLKDQSMAIRWVRKYISLFRGDSQLITVFGEGTGAAAVQLHMMSPLSRGNFSRAILMTGSALSLFARPNPNPLRIARLQAGALGHVLPTTLTSSQVIAYLRGIPAAQLVASYGALKQIIGSTNSVTIYRPVVEKYVEGQSFLHDSPLNLWAAGNYEQIPWMVGHVPNEGVVFAKVLLGLATDPTQWGSLVTQGASALTQPLQLNPSAAPALLQRFFGTTNLGLSSSNEVINLAYKLANEVFYEYPLMKSISQHLQRAKPLNAPLSIYFMNFTGPIGHGDDLQYILSRPALFPDFPIGSPGYLMASKMVKLFVEFARTGSPLPSFLSTCPSETSCKQIELSNGQPGFDPVQVELTNALNSELLNFWDGLYNSS